jgi:HPt (histidine-containing phosphotransfer) domain-containing protein
MESYNLTTDSNIQSAQPLAAEVINQEAFAELWEDLGEDADALQEIVEIFLEDAPKQITSARQALVNHNNKELSRIAHTLKGSSLYYGADRLANVCRELESNCQRDDFTAADSLLAQLEQEFQPVSAALQAILLKN